MFPEFFLSFILEVFLLKIYMTSNGSEVNYATSGPSLDSACDGCRTIFLV